MATWNDLIASHHLTKIGMSPLKMVPLGLAGYGGYELFKKGQNAYEQHQVNKMRNLQMRLQYNALRSQAGLG